MKPERTSQSPYSGRNSICNSGAKAVDYSYADTRSRLSSYKGSLSTRASDDHSDYACEGTARKQRDHNACSAAESYGSVINEGTSCTDSSYGVLSSTQSREGADRNRSVCSSIGKGIPQDLGVFFCAEPWDSERFLDIKRLSPAIHGEVRLVLDTLLNEKVVVKILRNATVRGRRRGELENPLVEIGAMSYLFSPHAKCPPQFIAKLKGVYEDADFTYMVTEYCVGGELFKEVVARKFFFERGVKAIALQLCFALLSLHTNGIAHRDVSLENTLLQADRTVCLIDFGQADIIYDEAGNPVQLTGTAGKSYYRAPEMTSQKSYYGPPADVFALGVQIFIMVCGSPPWQEAVPKDERFAAMTKSPASFEECLLRWNRRDRMSDTLVDLLCWIFVSRPSRRPTVEDMFMHPWFSFDAGVWRWVYKHAPSAMIRDQISKVENYLADHPDGKYFLKPIQNATSAPSRNNNCSSGTSPGNVLGSSGKVPVSNSRDCSSPAKSESKVKIRASKIQQVITRHFRPEH